MISERQKVINNRFIESVNALRKRKGIRSMAKFARLMKVIPQHFSDVKGWKNRVSPEVMSLIVTEFPEFNVLFVLTGSGSPVNLPNEQLSEFSFLNEDPIEYISAFEPTDFKRMKLELLVAKTRCQTLERALEHLLWKNTKSV